MGQNRNILKIFESDNFLFLVIIFFFFTKDFHVTKKNIITKKKTVITFHFFYLENCHFSAFKSQNMQKVSPSGILSLHFCQNIFIFWASILEKKSYRIENLSETDFRICLVKSQNHGVFFFVWNTENSLFEKPQLWRIFCFEIKFQLMPGKQPLIFIFSVFCSLMKMSTIFFYIPEKISNWDDKNKFQFFFVCHSHNLFRFLK